MDSQRDLRLHLLARLPSVAALVAVNALPLIGVVLFDWRAFDVVFLYWLENVIIGVINLLKILTCAPDAETLREQLAASGNDEQVAALEKRAATGRGIVHATKVFFAPFFAVHYGIFCTVHGVFVCVLLGGGGPGAAPYAPALEAIGRPGIQIAAAAMAASHLVSYFVNFLGRGEYRRSLPPTQMIQPYGRVIVLHLAILGAGFLTAALGSPIWLLVLVVVGKTLLDLALHLREHKDPEGGISDGGVMTTA